MRLEHRSTEGTFKLLRVLRKVMIQHVRELWAVVMDRRHAADNVAKRAALKDEWLELLRILANMRNRRGKLMPGWATVQSKPIYTTRSQLGQWRKLRRLQVASGGQRGIMSYFSHASLRRPTRDAQKADDGPAAAATAASSPAATAARLTATAATASQLRQQLASERTSEQTGKRRRQHDDDDPDDATSESPAVAETNTACAEHGVSAALAALLGAATAAPHAATADTADPPKRQLTVAESFQRATRRRTDDPGSVVSPPGDARR